MLYFSRFKTIAILLTVFAGLVYAAPNLFSKAQIDGFYGNVINDPVGRLLPNKQVTLGLDLQGGSHLLLRLNTEEIVQGRIANLRDSVRQILRDERIGYEGLVGQKQAVTVNIRKAEDVERAIELLQPLVEPVSAGLFGTTPVREVTIDRNGETALFLNVTDEGIAYRVQQATQQAIEVIRRRIDELGTTEPIVQRQGDDRILVQVPGFDDPEQLKGILNRTAKLSFRLEDESMSVEQAVQGRPPAGSSVFYDISEDPPIAILLHDRQILSGENLVDAQPGFDQQTNEPIVSFRLDTKGAQIFARISQENVGRRFAILLDSEVISAPVIRTPILGGTGQISGNFTPETANELAILMRAGALPASMEIIEERTVGPSLGADSIAAGEWAGLVGSILVLAFMLLAYGRFGVIANLALIANIALVMALLSILGATLTLPGIAGIVLTIGMAVDSNVLIYERIREERRNSRSVIQAIEAGFTRAFTTIVDANVTTFIVAVILFYFGSGPVSGFAVTLAIGIITTVFTAFVFTRWMIAFWVRRNKPKELPAAPLQLVKPGTKTPFMWLRRVTFTLSAAAAVATAMLFTTVNMNYGIDFKGGTSFVVRSNDDVANVADTRAALGDLNLGDFQVQEFGSAKDLLIRVELQDGGENAQQSVVAKVRGAISENFEFLEVGAVGPTISSELAFSGTLSVLIALLAIMVYIWLRFEWQFAVGAILATTHDVIMTIGMFVVTGLEFNLSSIAAILTIVGYSLNDTVVVYDRVRENLRRYKKMPLPQLLDLSMNETLSRTVLTSVTTLLALGALFFLGGEVIRSFTAAMIFGVVIGTYSSIFVAAPLLILFRLNPQAMASRADGAREKQATQNTSAVALE